MRLIDADLLIEEYKTSAENTFNRPIKFKNSLVYKQIKKAPTVNAIPIPENAKNGDVIKALFPNLKINDEYLETDHLVNVYFGIGNVSQFFEIGWWNAPYKERET